MNPLAAFAIYSAVGTCATVTKIWYCGAVSIDGDIASVLGFGTAMLFVRLGIVKR